MPSVDRRHELFIVTGIIISLFILIIAIKIAGDRLTIFSQASSSSSTGKNTGALSLENSYLFASPLSALSNGIATVRVTVFLLDDQGLGIGGDKIVLSTSSPLTVTPVLPVTDSIGRAIFDLTADNPGNYTITAAVSGVSLPQKVVVSFR